MPKDQRCISLALHTHIYTWDCTRFLHILFDTYSQTPSMKSVVTSIAKQTVLSQVKIGNLESWDMMEGTFHKLFFTHKFSHTLAHTFCICYFLVTLIAKQTGSKDRVLYISTSGWVLRTPNTG